jgi:hypothetical protein
VRIIRSSAYSTKPIADHPFVGIFHKADKGQKQEGCIHLRESEGLDENPPFRFVSFFFDGPPDPVPHRFPFVEGRLPAQTRQHPHAPVQGGPAHGL